MMFVDRIFLVEVHLKELVVAVTFVVLVTKLLHDFESVSGHGIKARRDHARVQLLEIGLDEIILRDLDELVCLGAHKVPLTLKRSEVDLADELHGEFGCHCDKVNTACGQYSLRSGLGPIHELNKLVFMGEPLWPIRLDGVTAEKRGHDENTDAVFRLGRMALKMVSCLTMRRIRIRMTEAHMASYTHRWHQGRGAIWPGGGTQVCSRSGPLLTETSLH
jgi:hypothetical protein